MHARTHTQTPRHKAHTYVFLEQGSQGWWPWRLSFPALSRVTLGDVQARSPGGAGGQQQKQTGPGGFSRALGRPARGAPGLLRPAGPLRLPNTCRDHGGRSHQPGKEEGLKAAAGTPHTSGRRGPGFTWPSHQGTHSCTKLCKSWGTHFLCCICNKLPQTLPTNVSQDRVRSWGTAELGSPPRAPGRCHLTRKVPGEEPASKPPQTICLQWASGLGSPSSHWLLAQVHMQQSEATLGSWPCDLSHKSSYNVAADAFKASGESRGEGLLLL